MPFLRGSLFLLLRFVWRRRFELREEEASHSLLTGSEMFEREIDVARGHGAARWSMVGQHVDHERRDAADLDERTRVRVSQAVRREQDPFDFTLRLFLPLGLDEMNDRARGVRRLF
jgi:hypothetical protein